MTAVGTLSNTNMPLSEPGRRRRLPPALRRDRGQRLRGFQVGL